MPVNYIKAKWSTPPLASVNRGDRSTTLYNKLVLATMGGVGRVHGPMSMHQAGRGWSRTCSRLLWSDPLLLSEKKVISRLKGKPRWMAATWGHALWVQELLPDCQYYLLWFMNIENFCIYASIGVSHKDGKRDFLYLHCICISRITYNMQYIMRTSGN